MPKRVTRPLTKAPQTHEHLVEIARRAVRLRKDRREKFFDEFVPSLPEDTQRELLRQIEREKCKTDLFYLTKEVLGYSLLWEPLHRPMAERITTKRPCPFVGSLYPRGHYKTTVITIGGTIFRLLNDPNMRILMCHSVLDLARAMLAETKHHMHKNPRFRYLFPEFCPQDPDTAFGTQDKFTTPARTRVRREASVRVGASEATLVSSHYDHIVFDDIVDEKNSETILGREKVHVFYQRALSLLDPGGTIDMVGTRWADGDLYGTIMEKRSRHWSWIVKVLRDEEYNYLLPRREVRVKDPDGFTCDMEAGFDEEEEEKLKGEQSLQVFLSQYFNDPINPETAKFSPKHLHYIHKIPDIETENVVVHTTVDPAISDRDGSCYTAIVTCMMTEDGNINVVEATRHKFGLHQLIDELFAVWERWRPMRVGIEQTGYQQAILKPLREQQRYRRIYFPVIGLRDNRSRGKDLRIEALQPFWATDRIFLRKGLSELEEEMMRYPVARYRDLLDALSYQIELFRVPGGRPKGLPEHRGLGQMLPACEPDRDDFPPGTWGHFRREQYLKDRGKRRPPIGQGPLRQRMGVWWM